MDSTAPFVTTLEPSFVRPPFKPGLYVYFGNVGLFAYALDGKPFVAAVDAIEAGDKYVELAKNNLDEMSFASPALAPGTLFMRTQTRLYRIGRTSRN